MPDAAPHPEAYCLTCGYRLDTVADPPRCPECGREFEPDDPTTVQIPGPREFRPQTSWVWAVIVLIGLLAIIFLTAPTMKSAH